MGDPFKEFSVWRQVPSEFTVTAANTRERKTWEAKLLFTDREDLAAELVALIYRYRWQIELFFKWLKCILRCRHWLAESPDGVTIQV